MRSTTLLAILLLLCGLGRTAAQTNDREAPGLRLGVHLFGSGTFYRAALDGGLPGVPSCCPSFTSGNGVNVGGGVDGRLRLSSRFDVDGRILFATLGGTLAAEERKYLNDHGTGVEGTFLHTIDLAMEGIGVEGTVGIYPIDRVRLGAGGSLGIVSVGTFEQKEEILEPKEIRFENGRRVRAEKSGEIPEQNRVRSSLLLSLGYELPLDGTGRLVAVPEITGEFGVTSLLKNESWRAHALRAGVSILYGFIPSPEPVPVAIAPPAPPADPTLTPPPSPPARLAAELAVACLDQSGARADCITIELEQIEIGNNAALLNYLFFEENSSALPSRYHRIADDPETRAGFDETALEGSSLDIYYDLLNIVGARMREHTSSTITLVGCNADIGLEEGRLDLSKKRAEEVRAYLTETWKIDTERIAVAARNLPENASRQGDSDGDQENRRVEIQSDDWRLLRPIVYEEKIYRSTIPSLTFTPEVETSHGLKSWEIVVMQDDREVTRFDGRGAPPATVDWSPALDQIEPDAPLTYRLSGRDRRDSVVATSPGTIPVELYRSDSNRSVDRYNLIIFPFNSSELTPAHDRIVSLINDRLTPGAEITISGHTDRMGEAAYNQELSEARASGVAEVLDGDVRDIRAMGNRTLLFDNDLPEGRYYCRTVNITIETPIE